MRKRVKNRSIVSPSCCTFQEGSGTPTVHVGQSEDSLNNDPSAVSPTETLLQLLLTLLGSQGFLHRLDHDRSLAFLLC